MLGTLILGGILIWYASSLVNPAQLTKLLSATVKDATGRDLKISGPVSLEIFPSIGVKAEQVSLSNAVWASDSQMLTLKRIEMNIRLLPLLNKRVEISNINLVGLETHLQTNQAGKANWDLSLPAPTISSTVAGGKSSNISPSVNTSTSSQIALDQTVFAAIESAHISDARVSYQDENGIVKIVLMPNLSFARSGEKTDVFIDLQYESYKLGLKGKISSLRRAILDWGLTPVKMDIDLDLTLNGKQLDITGQLNKLPQSLLQLNIGLQSKSFEFAPLVGSLALGTLAEKVGSAPIAKSTKGRFFFNDEKLPFDLLPEANGKISVNIDELIIPDQAPFTNLKANASFAKQKIEVKDLSFSLGKGEAQGQLSLSQFKSPNPSIVMKGMAQGFTLEQIIGTADASSKVAGGQTQIAFNFESSGSSLHQIASRATGALQIFVGPAKLGTKFIDEGGDLVVTVFDALNPMRKKSSQTVLDCGVAFLPIKSGVVIINNSIGVQTDRLNITGNGLVNLATESINLNIDPKEKSGLTTGIDLGGLVKLQGTLQNPTVGVNQAGVVNSAVLIGLGFLTGGVSIAAENAKSMLTKTQPCKTALHSWSEIYPGPK